MTPRARPTIYWTVADMVVLARRQLLHISRVPDELVTTALQPILLVVLFRYVFGGAISVPGTSYINFLIAGIFVQSIIFSSLFTGVGLATDLQRGLVDRFRSLPMAKSAVLTGRTLADLLRSLFMILLTWGIGLLVGFRPAGTFLNWLGAVGLLLLGSFMFSWFNALLGLVLRSVEAVQQSFVIWALPLMFASSALVPTRTMPDWLRLFAEHQPVSLLVNAVRGLVLGQPDSTATWQSLVWCISLLAICIPLSVWAYGRRATH
jgi:ABC-2 type transport system permease protein/oleandomycin transport system permease protein